MSLASISSRAPARLLGLGLGLTFCATLTACDPSRELWGTPGDGQGDSGDGDTAPDDAWFAMGQGEFGWDEIEEGEELVMVLGGQGLLMFPMPIRGQGFTIAEDPLDYTDPDMPILDIFMEIEGYNIGFGGYFSRVTNYPVPFVEIDDSGTFEFVYITIFVPDELADPCEIDGLPGEVYGELETADGYTLEWSRSVVIEVPSNLCA